MSPGAGAAVVAAKKAEEAKRENTITEEKRVEGAISAKTYITYVKNMGTPALLFALFLMALVERLLSVFTNVWPRVVVREALGWPQPG